VRELRLTRTETMRARARGSTWLSGKQGGREGGARVERDEISHYSRLNGVNQGLVEFRRGIGGSPGSLMSGEDES